MKNLLFEVLAAYRKALLLSVSLLLELTLRVRTSRHELQIIRACNVVLLFVMALSWVGALFNSFWKTFLVLTVILLWMAAEKFWGSRLKPVLPDEEVYRQYLQSEQWAAKQKYVFERDGYQCTRCKSPDDLQVYYLSREDVFNEKLYQLTTLCGKCHALQSSVSSKQ